MTVTDSLSVLSGENKIKKRKFIKFIFLHAFSFLINKCRQEIEERYSPKSDQVEKETAKKNFLSPKHLFSLILSLSLSVQNGIPHVVTPRAAPFHKNPKPNKQKQPWAAQRRSSTTKTPSAAAKIAAV